jgi:hypothetical protein
MSKIVKLMNKYDLELKDNENYVVGTSDLASINFPNYLKDLGSIHAFITKKDNKCYIVPLNNKNMTFIKRGRLEAEIDAYKPFELIDKDQIGFGQKEDEDEEGIFVKHKENNNKINFYLQYFRE